MSRINCPGCKRVLLIDESSRGETVCCPMCGRHFGVARFAEDDEPVDQPTSYKLKDEPDAPRPMPLLTDRDEEEYDDRPVRRPRRRRRRKASGLPDFLAQWNLDKVLLVGSVGVWFVLLGLALVAKEFSIGLFVVGLLLVLFARMWASTAASQEGVGSGCLMMLSPWYFLANLFNLEDRRPLFLFGVGIAYLLTGLALMSIFYSHG